MRFRSHSDGLRSHQVRTLIRSAAPLWRRREAKRDFPAKKCSGGEIEASCRYNAYADANCHFSHGMSKRSAKTTKPYSKNPRIDKLKSETNDIDVRNSVLAMMMRWPSPSLPPTNSPMTAPITDRVLATFRLLKRYGSALGSLTLTNSCQRPECRMRQRSSNSSSIATSPVTMFTTTGKNDTKSASNTFDVIP